MPVDREMERAMCDEVRNVRVIGARCASQETLHAFLKKKLDLPDYYGENLSALADCLSELSTPTRITIAINEVELEPGMQAYVLRFAQICAREALVNENLSLVIEHH